MKKLLRSPKHAAAAAGLIALVALMALLIATGERRQRAEGTAPDGSQFLGPSEPPPGFVPQGEEISEPSALEEGDVPVLE